MQQRNSSQIFLAFLLIGSTALGGGGSAHVQHHMVERLGWLSLEDYLECYTLDELLRPKSRRDYGGSFLGH
jgi:chromate transport protein ChrA